MIKDTVGQRPGDDAVECDGVCATWVHRRCAGLSKAAYDIISKSSDPFFCPQCRLNNQEKELTLLRVIVSSLSSKLESVCSDLASLKLNMQSQPAKGNAQTVTATLPSAQTTHASSTGAISSSITTPTQVDFQRRYNVVIFGLDECDTGTPWYVRCKKDFSAAGSLLSSIDQNISDRSLCDCFRLGRFKSGHSRPVLVKLARSADVLSILSNRKLLANHPGISIKPDLSKDQRWIESLLLKERRTLISAGTSSSIIRIRGSNLYVSNKKYGYVDKSKFVTEM